ncbi:hypothetical protein QCA50_012882 [Cerrena zonata]|uniref:60S acidic ribosomal protein P2 n=1 Tax=Cerrena zonata TaxID=2478898 RepID=A0AAW0G2Q1_9APHY
MKYLAAYLLLVQGGNASPSAADITSLLETVGVEADESRLSSLLKELEGKDVSELIAEGNTKLASVPTAGAGAAAGGAAATEGGAEEAAEEAKEEAKEESDDDMGFVHAGSTVKAYIVRLDNTLIRLGANNQSKFNGQLIIPGAIS